MSVLLLYVSNEAHVSDNLGMNLQVPARPCGTQDSVSNPFPLSRPQCVNTYVVQHRPLFLAGNDVANTAVPCRRSKTARLNNHKKEPTGEGYARRRRYGQVSVAEWDPQPIP